MDAQQLVSEFLDSQHGQAATAALAQQGINAEDAQQLLGHAATAAHEHVQEQHATSSEGHAGRNFFAAFAAGLARGDGFFKALVDGGEGILVGRITEALTMRAGLDSGLASTVAAAATPYLIGFLKQKLG
jgi:hypothetical protein